MKLSGIIGLIVLAVCFAFMCGTSLAGQPFTLPNSGVHTADWHIELVPYKGHLLRCLVKQSGSGSNGQWGGPSCDWTEYHHDYGWVKTR